MHCCGAANCVQLEVAWVACSVQRRATGKTPSAPDAARWLVDGASGVSQHESKLLRIQSVSSSSRTLQDPLAQVIIGQAVGCPVGMLELSGTVTTLDSSRGERAYQ